MAFDYSENVNLLTTGNGNNNVHIYNPFVREPNGILKGHSKSIINVKFVRADTRIMSFSHDKVLRVWSVQLQMLIYKVESVFPKGPERM